MARTVDAGSGSSFAVSVWWTISLVIGANAGVPERIDSSAPQSALVTMGGCGTRLAAWDPPAAVVVDVDVLLPKTPNVLVVVDGSGPPPGSFASVVLVVLVAAADTRPAGTT